MLIVETIGKIRRAYFAQKKSIKAICRELKVSRKVVRKVVRSGAVAFEYERSVQPQPKLGAWKGELDELLSANEGPPRRMPPATRPSRYANAARKRARWGSR